MGYDGSGLTTFDDGFVNHTSNGLVVQSGTSITSVTAGDIKASGDMIAFSSSDRRLKENIKNISSPLTKLSKIRGVEFDWKPLTEEEKKTIHSYEGHDIGVIAQEVEEILPDIVETRHHGYKAVKYEKLVPLLIEAIKELKQEVDELKLKIK